jgi:phosphoribosylamine--glycine ligase
MLTTDGPRVVEFNCRLGDPEAQVILPRLKTDLLEVMMRTAQGELEGLSIEWDQQACVGVVVASGGYPGDYATGYPIEGLDKLDKNVTVFHAGTKATDQAGGRTAAFATDGGRVLTLTALAPTVDEARRKVYDNVGGIRFEDSFYRSDIGACS